MYKQDYSKYFGGKNGKGKRTPKDILKTIWGWTKIVIFIFIIISMLWGCVQMYQSDYTVGQIKDMSGNNIFAPGVSFEIIIKSLGDSGYKNHFFDVDAVNGTISEYQFKSISSWLSAFSETGGSFFYGFFVYPLAFVLVGFIRLFSGTNAEGVIDATKANYGVSALFAIFFTSLLVRGITLAFTWKTQLNQEKMTNVTMKQAEIQAKYKGSSDPATKQKQHMEMMALYKKEGISPLSSMATQFLSMPFLFAMFSIVRSVRVLKVTTIGQITLIEQPWAQIQAGNYVYMSIIAVYLPLQILSMLLPMFLQMTKKSKKPITEKQRKARKNNCYSNWYSFLCLSLLSVRLPQGLPFIGSSLLVSKLFRPSHSTI
ncbi:inner membrane protein translocase component YidC [Spiroplasma clarkii]|uniref:membrane protein insertase YidC n=1 Tax=Spiroplasma clarkii TaxID=2139 RepID=UPI000B54F6A8|nr:membrane protein insertase YidC [Spiroplasma clarkii]ARU90889.1 inner membrane protein translocase component YidC [Spiroplasma clarkii]